MFDDKPHQPSLFPVGQGDFAALRVKQKSTTRLMNEASQLNEQMRIARREYDRLKGDWLAYSEALKKTSHTKWVDVNGNRFNRDSVKAIVIFLDSFQSKQCIRLGDLKDIVKELNERGASIDQYNFQGEGENC